jgi:hypothetical protein
MITGHLALAAFFWQRKADLETGWNSLRPSQSDKQTVKIRTVAVAVVAGPFRISLAPTGSLFALDHVLVDGVVEHAGEFQLIGG